MATRRIISTEKTILDRDDDPDSAPSSGAGQRQQPSVTAPAVPL